MGRAKARASAAPEPPERPSKPSDAEIAAAIAAILMGAIAVASAKQTIQEILKLALVGSLAGLPAEQLEDATRVGAEFATREAGDVQRPSAGADAAREQGGRGVRPEDAGGDGAVDSLGGGPSGNPQARSPLGRARFQNLLLRAHYALAATRRIAKDLRQGKRLGEAVLAEEKNFTAHREANATRLSGAQFAAAAQAHFGDRVTWIHSGKEDFRPAHKRADGKQFNISSPPASTNGLPGTLPNCGCTFGPPIEGAPDLL